MLTFKAILSSYMIRLFLLLAVMFCNFFVSSLIYALEGSVQNVDSWFLCPYVNFGWSNSSLGNNKFDSRGKIMNSYFGLYAEYGLLPRLTLGFDLMGAKFWNTENGHIHLHPKDQAIALQNIQPFLRFALIKNEKFNMIFYFSANAPAIGKGSGYFNTYGKYNKWTNTAGIEFGFVFSQDTKLSVNFRYSAMYNSNIDTMEAKITFFQRLPKNFIFYSTFKKSAYISKGSSFYAFSKDKSFNIDAFNFINNTGLVQLDLYFGKKINKNIIIMFEYSRSFHAHFLGNYGMNKNYNAFCLQSWIFI